MMVADPLKNLRETAVELGQAENWPEYIRVLAELIPLEDDQQRQAVLYTNRSTAFHKLEDYPHALDDINRVIELSPDDQEAYHWRGVLHGQSGHLSEAITDFNKTLNINPRHARAYQSRGITYVKLRRYTTAISDLEHAIALDPKDTLSYLNCSFAYRSIRAYDKAVAVATRAIRRDPTNALAYSHRGMAYLYRGSYGRALNDLVCADRHDETLKTRFPGPYFASNLHRIYAAGKTRQRNIAFRYLNRLFNAIAEIQYKLLCSPGPVQEVAHYTSLHTLKSLTTGNLFRLYNAAYMNDPEEGRVFFEVMENDYGVNVRDKFYEGLTHYPSPAYIGSFIMVDENSDEPKDKLFLWRTYGRHETEDAAGACVLFTHDGRTFAGTAPPTVGYMSTPHRPALYRVVYRTDQRTMSEDLRRELRELSDSLEQIEANVLNGRSGETAQLRKLVCELLDSIRFLFKKDHYREEREVRIVENRGNEGSGDGVKVDTDRIPPRLYVEAGDSVRFIEVILGPEVRGPYEWKRWLKERNSALTVTKSRIEYGERYP